MNQKQIVYSFFIVDQGLLHVESLLIVEDLHEISEYAELATIRYLAENGYMNEGNDELATEDGYALIVKSLYGVPADEYQEIIWNYRMDGEETVSQSIGEIKYQ